MAFGDNLFQAGSQSACAAPAVVPPPVEVRVGDDWTIVCNLTDNLGRPLALGQATIGAVFYPAIGVPSIIAGLNGSVTVTDAPNGVVGVVVSSFLTQNVVPVSTSSTNVSSLSLYMVDSLGHRHTFPPKRLLVLRPQDPAPIATELPAVQFITFVQGPAGASNTYTAGQIEDLIAAAKVGLVTSDQLAQAIAAIPPSGISQATAQALIAAFFVAGDLPETQTDLIALIDARVQNALQNVNQLSGGIIAADAIQGALTLTLPPPLALVGGVPKSVVLTGSVTQNFVLSGAVPKTATLALSLSSSVSLVGSLPVTAALSGSLTQFAFLVSAVPGSASLSANLSLDTPLSGGIVSGAAILGSIVTQAPSTVALSGAIPSSASFVANPSQDVFLSGGVPASASFGAILVRTVFVTGIVPAATQITGSLQQSLFLTSQVPASVSLTGYLAYGDSLSGSVPKSAVLTGAATITKDVSGGVPSSAALAGSIAAVNTKRSPMFGFGLLGAAA